MIGQPTVAPATAGVSSIRIGDQIVLDRACFLLRDTRWGTASFIEESSETVATPDGSVIRLHGEFGGGLPMSVDLVARIHRNEITLRARAVALSEIEFARVGWNVTLPTALFAGALVRAQTPAGAVRARLPHQIARQEFDGVYPRGLLPPASQLTLQSPEGTIEIRSDDALLDLEDQRNWSDPSYKIYSAPDSVWPARAPQGAVFRRVLHIRMDGFANHGPSPERAKMRESGPVKLPRICLGGTESDMAEATAASFACLNTRRPQFVGAMRVPVNGSVHAADDESVMATASVHGVIARELEAILPGCSIRLDPVDFSGIPGEWRDEQGEVVAHPARPSADPRRHSTFGAAWVIASVAGVAGAGCHPTRIAYFDSSLVEGPAKELIEDLGRHAGAAVTLVSSDDGLAGVRLPSTDVLWLANPTDEPKSYEWSGHAGRLGARSAVRLRHDRRPSSRPMNQPSKGSP